MEGTGRSSTRAAVLLSAALALAGCCLSKPGGTTARLNRDTPENAFEFFRVAFETNQAGDQFDCFHPDFVAEQGLSRNKYEIARTLSPGTFRRAGKLLGAARLVGDPEFLQAKTERGLLTVARLHISTPEGVGTFLLVDWPEWEAFLSDPDLPRLHGAVKDMDGAVHIEGDRLRAGMDIPLEFPPADGTRIRRFTIHHDWLLWHIESLEGFEAFLGEVKATEEKTKEAPQ